MNSGAKASSAGAHVGQCPPAPLHCLQQLTPKIGWLAMERDTFAAETIAVAGL
jgi:hypothetical protein